jgi:hypothetical protein
MQMRESYLTRFESGTASTGKIVAQPLPARRNHACGLDRGTWTPVGDSQRFEQSNAERPRFPPNVRDLPMSSFILPWSRPGKL